MVTTAIRGYESALLKLLKDNQEVSVHGFLTFKLRWKAKQRLAGWKPVKKPKLKPMEKPYLTTKERYVYSWELEKDRFTEYQHAKRMHIKISDLRRYIAKYYNTPHYVQAKENEDYKRSRISEANIARHAKFKNKKCDQSNIG